MSKRLTRWSMLLVGLLSFSFVLAACGENTPTPATGTGANPQNAAQPGPPAGVKSALAGSFPDTTSFYLTLNTDTNSDQIKSWKKIVDYLSNIPEVKVIFSNADLLALARIGTYDGDIQPWIGSELAIGLTDINSVVNLANSFTGSSSTAASAPGEIPLLIGAPVKDQAKADAFVNKIAAQLKTMGLPDPTTETYKDAKLYTFNVMVLNIVVGVGKDKFFIGGGPNLVKGAFDRTADKSLANVAQYKTVTGKLPAGNLGFIYSDFQAVIKAIINNPQVKQAIGSNQANLEYTGSVGVTFSTADEGFRVDTYQTYLPDKTPPAVADQLKKGANPSKILNALPENTLGFFNSRDAASLYDMALTAAQSMGGVAGGTDFDKGIKEFEQQTGLNVKNDLIGLFTGEFAGFLTGNPANKDLPVGFGVVSEASDKAAAQAKLDKIISAAEKDGKVKFESKTSGNTSYKSAKMQSGPNTTINLGVAGNYTFLTVGDEITTGTITAATGGKNFANGAASANFNKVKGVLPTDNTGYFYVDLQAALKLANDVAPAKDAQQLKAATGKLDKLLALGGATRQNPNEAATTVFIYFPVTK